MVDGVGVDAGFNSISSMSLSVTNANEFFVIDDNMLRHVFERNVTTRRFHNANGGYCIVGQVVSDVAGNYLYGSVDYYMIAQISLSTWDLVVITGNSGINGYVDGVLATAQFSQPAGISRDAHDNLYVTDKQYLRLISVSNNVVLTIATQGSEEYRAISVSSDASVFVVADSWDVFTVRCTSGIVYRLYLT